MRSGRLRKVDRRDKGEKRWSGRMETSWKGKKSLLSIIVLALLYGVAGGRPPAWRASNDYWDKRFSRAICI
jgi:hypothetical protein